MSADEKATAPTGASADNRNFKTRYIITLVLFCTSPRATLTPSQHVRFGQSVGQAIEAEKATSFQGFKHGEVNHE